MHTTFHRDDGDTDDIVEPSDDNDLDDNDCDLEVVCFDQGGHRHLWQATLRHLDAVPLALVVLRAAIAPSADAGAAVGQRPSARQSDRS